MTPKEKAQYLVDKYANTSIHFPYIDSEDGRCLGTGYMVWQSSKQCALIAVDEIISTFIDIDPKLSYWKSVKQEIENL